MGVHLHANMSFTPLSPGSREAGARQAPLDCRRRAPRPAPRCSAASTPQQQVGLPFGSLPKLSRDGNRLPLPQIIGVLQTRLPRPAAAAGRRLL